MILLNTIALEHAIIKHISGYIAQYASLKIITPKINGVIAEYVSLGTYSRQTNTWLLLEDNSPQQGCCKTVINLRHREDEPENTNSHKTQEDN